MKAPLANPTFTGTVIAPTVASTDNSTKVATTAYVTSAVSAETAARDSAISTAVSAEAVARDSAISSAISGMSTGSGMTSESVNSAISSESDALKNIIDSLVGGFAATNLGVTGAPEYTQNGDVNNPFKYLVFFSYSTKNLGSNYYYRVYYAPESTPSAKELIVEINNTNSMVTSPIYPLEPDTNYIFSVILFNFARNRLIDNSEVTLYYTTPSAPAP